MKAFAVGCVYAEHFWFLIVEWVVRAALFLLPFLFFNIEMLHRKIILRMPKAKKISNRNESQKDYKILDNFKW
jgi:hypothetical protein